jgi:hypothetical protein
MNSPLNAYVDGSENKAQDLTGVMKDYFSSVKSTTMAAIDAGKKKKAKEEADKKKKTERYQKSFKGLSDRMELKKIAIKNIFK